MHCQATSQVHAQGKRFCVPDDARADPAALAGTQHAASCVLRRQRLYQTGMPVLSIAWRVQIFPDYKDRVLRHEAAHFLIGYLLGVPAVSYDLGIGREVHTSPLL